MLPLHRAAAATAATAEAMARIGFDLSFDAVVPKDVFKFFLFFTFSDLLFEEC